MWCNSPFAHVWCTSRVPPGFWSVSIYNAPWGRPEIEAALRDALKRPGQELIRGAQGVPEGIDPARAEEIVDKFHEKDGLLVVRAGGKGAGQSAIIGGWPAQRRVEEIKIVSQEVGI